MTFSAQVKEEIFEGKPLSGKERGFFSYGIVMCAGEFSEERCSIHTESENVAMLYAFSLTNILETKIKVQTETSIRGEKGYTVSVAEEDALRVFEHFSLFDEELLTSDNGNTAFLSGAFMACGTVSAPEKGYRLEFCPASENASDLLFRILTNKGYPPKTVKRNSREALYTKDSGHIEDLLAMMGAMSSSFKIMETKVLKEVRNKSNRLSNCDNANIDKIVDAAQGQIADINYIYEMNKQETLSTVLKEMAEVRLQNPDLSLRELSEVMEISRSGVNHRLKKLSEIATEIRKMN